MMGYHPCPHLYSRCACNTPPEIVIFPVAISLIVRAIELRRELSFSYLYSLFIWGLTQLTKIFKHLVNNLIQIYKKALFRIEIN